MDWVKGLFFGNDAFWGGGVAHSVLILALVIATGIILGKIKIAGISLGVTWILFVGIIVSHFGMRLDEHLLHFMKEFGLILFVYSIGLQVGPGFFASFKKGGLTLNLLATAIVALGVLTACILHWTTGVPITTMVGILSGAVTNTPGLGAAQQAYSDMTGLDDPSISLGYAVAYPLGVLGIIGTIIVIRYIFRIKLDQESRAGDASTQDRSRMVEWASAVVKNPALAGKNIDRVIKLLGKTFVVSRVCHADGRIEIASLDTVLKEGDKVLVVATADTMESVVTFLGERIEMSHEQWDKLDSQLVSRRIMITKSRLNGKPIRELKLRSNFGVNVTRVNRAGVDLVAHAGLELQMGDRLTVVGSESAIADVAKMLGNSMRRLREPNLIPIFIGIFLGVFLGSVPFVFPGIPQPVKLGLAGGPLIVSILISKFGPHFRLVTYTTMSANLMLREVGIALFLASVGLGAGEGFVDTVVYGGGYRWIAYGVIITIVPILLVGLFARKICRMNYFTIMGLIAGSTTDPPALAYSNGVAGNDMPSVSYATVYPLTMFLRVLTAQMLVLLIA